MITKDIMKKTIAAVYAPALPVISDTFEYIGCKAVCKIFSTVVKTAETLFAPKSLVTVDVTALTTSFSHVMAHDTSKRLHGNINNDNNNNGQQILSDN
jgi:hypothetical protein